VCSFPFPQIPLPRECVNEARRDDRSAFAQTICAEEHERIGGNRAQRDLIELTLRAAREQPAGARL